MCANTYLGGIIKIHNMKKLLPILVFAFCFSFNADAQDFKQAAGLRLGVPLAASYKLFISDYHAVEGIAAFRTFVGGSWFSLGGAYQIHNDITQVDNLQWYYGGGASVLFYSYDSILIEDSGLGFGINGYLGLSYTFDSVPINLTVDWIPTLFINGIGGFGAGNGALAVRYIF